METNWIWLYGNGNMNSMNSLFSYVTSETNRRIVENSYFSPFCKWGLTSTHYSLLDIHNSGHAHRQRHTISKHTQKRFPHFIHHSEDYEIIICAKAIKSSAFTVDGTHLLNIVVKSSKIRFKIDLMDSWNQILHMKRWKQQILRFWFKTIHDST